LSTPFSKAAEAAELQRHLVAGPGEQPPAAAVHDREDEQVRFVRQTFPGTAS
jgi:hypothetical protein